MATNNQSGTSRNSAFFRLSNRHICATLRRFIPSNNSLTVSSGTAADSTPQYGFSSLGDLALYAMIGTVLSNPTFQYAAGGMQNLLLRHTKNRYFSLHGAIRRLSSMGYLMRTRIPEGKNCFRDYYTLSHQKSAASSDAVGGSMPCARCLTAEKGAEFRASYRPFLPPTEDYTEVSIPMLMDPNLSLGAKGLYIVIARYLRLQSYKPELVLTKEMLRGVCPEGCNAFDRLFRELRTCGYLYLTRCRSAHTGYPGYRYSLNKTPDTEAVSSCHAEKSPHSADTVHSCVTPTASSDSTGGRIAVPTLSDLHSQIDYDCLTQDFSRERLDCIVSIMHSYLSPPKTGAPASVVLGGTTCSREEVASRFSALDSEDIRFVLDTYHDVVKTTKIRNIRRYLTACLYHAKENLALALDAFAVKAPGYSPT